MYDMTQWVVGVIITLTEATYSMQMFMEHVLLKVGICIVVVVDDGNNFQGMLKKMRYAQ